MIRRKDPPPTGSSYSTEYLLKKMSAPQVSAAMASSVSDYRKGTLQDQISQGIFSDGPNNNTDQLTRAGVVTFSGKSIVKNAQIVGNGLSQSSGSSGSVGFQGAGGTVNQVPEIYSPLWLTSNLNLPRDRATINSWCRAFFALNPFVHNAINLHSTYPISKLNIKCADKKVEKFFNDMIEEIGLMNICVQASMEYWLLGEAFIYAELDPNKGKWSRLLIQNPDYMVVNRTVIADEPMIMLRPDENLKRIVQSNKPADAEQRKQLDQYIIDAVRRGQNIPMNNFNISHIARKISPYEIRGTGLPVPIFRQLMLFDSLRESKFAQAWNMINPLTLVKVGSEGMEGLHPSATDLEAYRQVFECHDEETEVLTDDGFKKFDEVIEYSEVVDGTCNRSYITNVAPKQGIKIACFNAKNEQLEYYSPINASLYNYNGDMCHFKNEKMDIKVTPNHKMWVREKIIKQKDKIRNTFWDEWKKVEAQNININGWSQFRSQIKWMGKEIEYVEVCDKKVPIEMYLELLGYIISEGYLYSNDKYAYNIQLSQTLKKYAKEMASCLNKFASIFDKHCQNKTVIEVKENRSPYWLGTLTGKQFYEHFRKEIQDENGLCKSYNKQVPRWILELSPRLLNIFLNALTKGDGRISTSYKENGIKKQKVNNSFEYFTVSKQLADDIYEIVYKCGYVPTMYIDDVKRNDNIKREPCFVIGWSPSNKGNFPYFYRNHYNSRTKEKTSNLNIEKYIGKVWCFEVPTGLFITRRNGKITIQGNSLQYNKDAKIFTHPGVTVERVGWGQGIYDISGDITQLIKEMYVGLMVPPVIMDGGGDVTYANAGVTLDVLRQRYMQFRTYLSSWLKRKIFAPISDIQGFWEYNKSAGSKSTEKQLIIPDVEWNHMSLFDAGDHIANLITLTQPTGAGESPRASMHTLYRSMGLEWEDEQRKLRKEAIQTAIAKKEAAALELMTLNTLRSLDEDEDISEPISSESKEVPVPGEESSGASELPGFSATPPPAPPPPTAI